MMSIRIIKENYNLPKWKNLTIYLNNNGHNIDKIDESNADDILSKFILINKKHSVDDNSDIKVKCICSRKLINYYYLLNKENGEMMIIGGTCRKIFYDTLDKSNILNNKTKITDTNVYNDIINLFTTGVFEKITDWNVYIEECIKKYMEDCSLIQYETLKKLYITNNYITKYLLDNKKKEQLTKNTTHRRDIIQYFNNVNNYNYEIKQYQRCNLLLDYDYDLFRKYTLYPYHLETDIDLIFKYFGIYRLDFDTKSDDINKLLHKNTINLKPHLITVYNFYDKTNESPSINDKTNESPSINDTIPVYLLKNIWSYDKIKDYLTNEKNYMKVRNPYHDRLQIPNNENIYFNSYEKVQVDFRNMERMYNVDLSRLYK